MNFDEQPKTDMADDIPSESLHDYCLKLGLQVRDGNNGNSKMAVGTSAAQSENTQGNGRPISPRHAKLNQLANDATKKSFACKNCGKAFANSRQFLKHKCSSKVKSEEDSEAKPRRKPGRPRKQRGNGNKATKTVVKDKGDAEVVKQAAESNGQTSAKFTDEAQLAVVHLADHTYIRDELEANDDGTRSTDSATAADCAEECSEKAEAKRADDKSCSTLQPEPVPKTDELSQKSPGEKDEELVDNASADPESKPAVDDEATSGKTSVSGGLKRKYSFKNEEVTCPHCNKGFHFKKRLERHVKICGRNLVCEFCGEDFNNGGKHAYSKYEQHYYTHVEKKPHPCTVCSQSFVRKQDLDKHKVIHTTEFVPRTCLQCGAVFSSDKLLSKHAKKHEKPLWSCPKCQQQFVRQVIFEKHVKACQTQVSCEVCGKVFQCLSKNLKSRYQEHMFTHTGEKPYKCQFCERAFRDRSTRKKHERSHTGEKPYPCTLCDRAFSQLRLLRNHVRTHTGEKPYECNLCELAFAKQCNLKYHMRVHTKEKPYTCQLCSKSFTQSGTYHKHMRRHNQTSTNTSTTAENTSPSTPSTSAGVSVVPVPLQETALSDVQAPVEVTPDTTTEAEVSTSTHVIQEIPISNNEITIIVSEGVDGAAASLATIDVEQISSLLASCS